MLLLGASGSGKSSLVRAGILPDLMAPGVVAGVTAWRYASSSPPHWHPRVRRCRRGAARQDRSPRAFRNRLSPERN